MDAEVEWRQGTERKGRSLVEENKFPMGDTK